MKACPGERLAVVSVFERDRKLLEYLDGLGIRPGVHLDVVASEGELELRTAAGHPLERSAAAKVWVEQLG